MYVACKYSYPDNVVYDAARPRSVVPDAAVREPRGDGLAGGGEEDAVGIGLIDVEDLVAAVEVPHADPVVAAGAQDAGEASVRRENCSINGCAQCTLLKH